MDDLTRLLVAARDGDQLALVNAIRESQADVWRCCAWIVDAAEADDLVQETYVHALRALPSYRVEASGRTWLMSIARRTCADALRRRVRSRRFWSRIAPRDGSVGDASRQVALETLIESLAPERREAFVLTQLMGCSYEEAATVCDVPIGTVRSRVARARADLTAAIRAAEAM